jgi:hypothetical protein
VSAPDLSSGSLARQPRRRAPPPGRRKSRAARCIRFTASAGRWYVRSWLALSAVSSAMRHAQVNSLCCELVCDSESEARFPNRTTRAVRNGLWVRVEPTPLPKPYLVAFRCRTPHSRCHAVNPELTYAVLTWPSGLGFRRAMSPRPSNHCKLCAAGPSHGGIHARMSASTPACAPHVCAHRHRRISRMHARNHTNARSHKACAQTHAHKHVHTHTQARAHTHTETRTARHG